MPSIITEPPVYASQNTSPVLVADQASFNAAIAHLEAQAIVALDTEFVRRKTYFAELGLIQIASFERVYLFDPTAGVDDSALGALLAAPHQLKVLHSVGEDLEVLRDRFGNPPGPIFDTQIAAAMVGLGGMQSLAKLVATLLGQSIDKGETTSDWLKRPLSSAQIAYAAKDVTVLLPMHAMLQSRLDALGRSAWLAEDCQRIFEKAKENATDLQPHHKIKTAHIMSMGAQQKLRQLLLWRENKARERNLPKSWVLDTPFLCEAAERAWRDQSHFQKELEQKAPRSARRGAVLWELLHSEALTEGFVAAPAALSGSQNVRYKQLRVAVDARAAELAMPAELLATRKLLEAAIEPNFDVQAAGWRGELLHSLLSSPI